MSILGKIFGRIFPKANAGQAPAATQVNFAARGPAPGRPRRGAAATVNRVDIEQVLDGMAANNPQKLNWRTSIVDLMKLVGMDSTLQERKELADELGYSGDKSDSGHEHVAAQAGHERMADNGGKVPAN